MPGFICVSAIESEVPPRTAPPDPDALTDSPVKDEWRVDGVRTIKVQPHGSQENGPSLKVRLRRPALVLLVSGCHRSGPFASELFGTLWLIA